MKSYSQEHFWLESVGDGRWRLGITSQAAHKLGPSVYVQFQPQTRVKKGQLIAVVESTKAATDLEAPIDLEDIEYHDELLQHPEWIYEESLGRGWLLEATPSVANQLKLLLTQEEYSRLTQRE